MATIITAECINCGACEPECPNNAISQGDPIYVIDPLLCTECVGFHDYEACAAVCPVDCCVTDPDNIESEEVLIARARALHKDIDFGENFQSRFRKTETAKGPAPTQTPASEQSASPSAAQATPQKTAVEKKSVPPTAAVAPGVPAATAPVSSAAPATSRPAPKAEAKMEVKPKKTFPQEVADSFEEVAVHHKQSTGLSRGFKVLVALLQPVLGALSHNLKKNLEQAIEQPVLFSAAGSTGLNILLNAVLYPVLCAAVAVAFRGPAVLFSQEINTFVLVGILLAIVEGAFRLRDGIFHAKPAAEMTFPGALYGPVLGLLLAPVLARRGGVVRELPVPVDGFYSEGFVEKLERERRYGNIYTIEDRGGALYLRMEFPRSIPEIGIASRSQIPDEMPDYDYDLLLRNGQFVVKGRCTDERVRKISSSVGAFPPEFTTIIPLQDKVTGFAHRFENKNLEVFLLKDNPAK